MLLMLMYKMEVLRMLGEQAVWRIARQSQKKQQTFDCAISGSFDNLFLC